MQEHKQNNLSDLQQKAVEMLAGEDQAMIITGGPGNYRILIEGTWFKLTEFSDNPNGEYPRSTDAFGSTFSRILNQAQFV